MIPIFQISPGNSEPYRHWSARILIVEDSREHQALLINQLSQYGFRLFVASDGKDGYRKAVGLMPDLILMDLRMPIMDGVKACRLLQANERTRDIPVIFITASNAAEDRIAGLNEGAVDYIGKPFDFDEVLARIRIHIRLAIKQRKPATDVLLNSLGSPSEDELLFSMAIEFIAERIDSPPSTAELATLLGTHEKRLVQIFRSLSGMTVSGFVREERLRRARELLATTKMEIQAIGALVGYPNSANFSTAFRERFGTTPREYRHGVQSDTNRKLERT